MGSHVTGEFASLPVRCIESLSPVGFNLVANGWAERQAGLVPLSGGSRQITPDLEKREYAAT